MLTSCVLYGSLCLLRHKAAVDWLVEHGAAPLTADELRGNTGVTVAQPTITKKRKVILTPLTGFLQ
jgi:hypothetical protein